MAAVQEYKLVGKMWHEIEKIWHEIEPSARAMVGDALLFMLGLMVLGFSFAALLALEHVGYPPPYVVALETLHFWGYFCVLAVLLLDLVSKVAAHAFRKK